MRARSSCWWVLAWAGCGGCEPGASDGPPARSDTPLTGDADTALTDDTDTPGTTGAAYAKPTLLEATCTPDANPLAFSCAVTVDPSQPVQVRFFRADGIGSARTFTSDLVATDHTVPLYFMGPDHDYTVEVTATAWPDDPVFTTTVTTGIPPTDIGTWLEVTGTSTMGLIGTELPCSFDPVAVIYDTETGELVWYRSVDPDPAGSLGASDMVRFTHDKTILAETGTSIVEMDLLGNDLVRIDQTSLGLPDLHHDIFAWNGHYYALYLYEVGPNLSMDAVVILDGTGHEITTWYAHEHLDVPPGATSDDLLHTNAIYVDASGDMYLSFLAQGSVAKLDGDVASPTFGTPRWIIAGAPQRNNIGFDVDLDWSLVGGVNTFDNQHNAHLGDDGRLMLLDNEHGRGLVLSVDEANLTATVDAAYDTVDATCLAQGTAMNTAAGNAVVACSTSPVREYDHTTGALLWQADVRCRQASQIWATRWYPLDAWTW